MADTTENVEELFERTAQEKQLYKAIKTLTDTQRRRVFSYFFHGLSYREIGRMEGVSDKSISESIVQALRKLKNSLEKI